VAPFFTAEDGHFINGWNLTAKQKRLPVAIATPAGVKLSEM
jgi:hypothetical protein